MSGYDSEMMNSLQILPSYWAYFNLTTETLALNAAIIFVGSVVATPFGGFLATKWGRKVGIAITCVIATVGVIIQTAAVNEAMFAIGRFIIGVSIATSYAAIPSYLSEVSHPGDREILVGLWGSAYHIGSILSAVITYGSQYMLSTWSWRLPSIIQILPAALTLVVLPFVPESPRWLIYENRKEEALAILVKYHGSGDPNSPIVTVQYREICSSLDHEKETQTVGFKALISTRANRWRFGIVAGIGVFCQLSGGNIASYYLGIFLETAGIVKVETQLGINIGRNILTLFTAVAGSYAPKYLRRRPSFMICTLALGLFMILEAILTKLFYGKDDHSASIGIVTVIFLFSAVNSFIWAPLSGIYAIEVLSYSIRAHGLSAFSGILYCTTFFNVYVIPYAMRITWGFYLITGLWCGVEVVIMYFYWPETFGMTLEEVDYIFNKDRADGGDTTLKDIKDAEEDAEADGSKIVERVTVAEDGKASDGANAV